MLIFLGSLVLIAFIVKVVWEGLKRSYDEHDQKLKQNPGNSYSRPKNFPAFPFQFNSYLLLGLAILLFAMNGAFFWANAGTAYAVQYPWGGDKMVKTQGIKFQGWGRTIPLSYEISLQDMLIGEDETLPESRDGIYNRRARLWEFSDAIKAEIATAVVVGVSVDDEETFLNMADRNRSEGKLIYGRVIPNIDAAIKNTAKLMDAQEYISGKASDFDRYFRDQLENGMYLVEEYIEEEEAQIIGDTLATRLVGGDNTNKQSKWRIKRDEQGNIMRDSNSNSMTQYGIRVYQAQVTGIDWEPSFDERLQLQKEQVAQTQLEKQEAEKEYYRAQKEIARGEADKAAERARLEKEQIKLTIEAETEAKVAKQNVIAEREKLEVAKLAAQSKTVAADATFYENSKRVQAGLTPQERAKLELDKARVIASEFAKMSTPSIVITGSGGVNGDGSNGDLTNAIIQAEMAKKLLNSSN